MRMIIKEGYLMKRSSGKMIKQWNRRKFFLRMDGSITYDSVEKKRSVMELSGCALEPRSVKDITKQGDVYVFTIRRKQEDGKKVAGKLKLGSKDYDCVCSWYLAMKETIDSIENETRPWNRLWNLRERKWDSDTTQRRLERLRNVLYKQTLCVKQEKLSNLYC